MATATVQVWLMIDADGEYTVGKTEEAAIEAFDDDIGGSGPRRLICLTLKAPTPELLRVTATIPDLAGETLEIVGAA